MINKLILIDEKLKRKKFIFPRFKILKEYKKNLEPSIIGIILKYFEDLKSILSKTSSRILTRSINTKLIQISLIKGY